MTLPVLLLLLLVSTTEWLHVIMGRNLLASPAPGAFACCSWRKG
jgi:hypothetical protein